MNKASTMEFDAAQERQRLRRVCYRLTGDATAAEDLAQEAILIGLRRAGRPGDAPRDWSPYLFGVARRLCMAWRARNGAEESLLEASHSADAAEPSGLPDVSAADPLETLLLGERERLIEQALSVLKSPARQILLARYVEDLSVSEIGERWKISENAAMVRIHRGRDALRKVLETTLRTEASAHGLLSAEAAQGWRETTIFCCRCGRERLQGRFLPGNGAGASPDFALRCPSCPGMLNGMTTDAASMDAAAVLSGVNGFRAGLNRVNRWWQDYLADALESRTPPCPRCGLRAEGVISAARHSPGLSVWCEKCGAVTFFIHPTGLLYHSEEAQDFWRRFPRMRNLSPQEIVCGNRPAVLTRFADRATSARIEMVFDAETLRCLRVETTH